MTEQLAVASISQLSEALRDVVRVELAALVGKEAKQLRTPVELCKEFGVSRATLVKWISRDSDPLPCHYLSGREPRFLISEVIPWVARQPKKAKP
jgi:predicted DNA-binding transcriptional regulator AlpA